MAIAVLGPLRLDGKDVAVGRRERAVLAVLALYSGQPVSADRLIDAVWGETPPQSAPKVLQGCVVRLRKVLGREAVETSERGYTLAIAPDDVDARRFERMVVRGRELLGLREFDRAAYVLGEALGLWHGLPYLEVEDWQPAALEAERLSGLRLDAEELKVEAALQLGRHGEVMTEAQRMVHAAPMRERRWALLAHAQYQAGRQGEALRTIHEVKALLIQRLGLDPSPDLAALEQAILRQDESLLVSLRSSPASAVCPYQGLLPFDVEDADSFFGRDANLATCLAIAASTLTLTVAGPSGSGKSSLVRAGIAAALRGQGRNVTVFSPGEHPMQAMAAAASAGARAVLVIDQFEEVFSLCEDPTECAAFIDAVVRRAETVLVVVTLRADHLADVAAYHAFARLVERGLHLLGAMSQEDLRKAIEAPASQAGLTIEPGLVELLLRDVENEPGALPLLSHALMETWKRREGNTMTVAGYRDTGAIRGSVAKSAERVYAGIEPGQRHLLRDLLLRLVSHGVEGEPVRSRVPRRLIGSDPELDRLIEQLVAARLVSSDDGVLEISHEALARAWPRLHAWLEDDVEGQRILHHLTATADAWDSMGRPDSELYRGARLSQALEWKARKDTTLTSTEIAFLAAGDDKDKSEQRAAEVRARSQARLIRRLRGVLASAAVLLVAALIAGTLAIRQTGNAKENAAAALAAETAAEARRVGANALAIDDIDTSMLLAVAGARLDDSSATRANLLAVLGQRPQLIGSVPYDGDAITGLEASPDGHRLAVYDLTGQVRLYATKTWEELGRIRGAARTPIDPTSPLAFSPDGGTAAVGMAVLARRPLRLFDGTTLEPLPLQLRGLPERPSRVVDLEYSADGTRMAAVFHLYRRDPGLRTVGAQALVWNMTAPDGPALLLNKTLEPKPDGDFWGDAVALSPDGQTVYTSRPISAYDVTTGDKLYSRELTPNRQSTPMELSPDGKWLAVSMWPDGLRLLDAATGRLRRVLHGHSERALDFGFSDDGMRLASTSSDRTAIVWDVATGDIVERLMLGESGARGVDFSHGGKTLYTGGADRAIRGWDLQGRHRFVSKIVEPTYYVGESVVAPGGRFAAYSWGQGWKFLDVSNATRTRWLGIDAVDGWDWNPQGDRFATVGQDAEGLGFIKVWDPTTGKAVGKSTTAEFIDVRYSLDGATLAVLDASGLAKMLDADSLVPLGPAVQLEQTGWGISLAPDNRTALVLTPGYNNGGNFESLSRSWDVVDLDDGTVIKHGAFDFNTAGIARSPDGAYAAIGGRDGEVAILDLDTGELLRPAVEGHSLAVWYLSYSSDGSRLVSAADDGSVSLWDGATGELLGTVVAPEQRRGSAEFLADGSSVIITTGSNAVYRWDTRREYAIEFACRLAGRDFTHGEWQEVFGDRPYEVTCPA